MFFSYFRSFLIGLSFNIVWQHLKMWVSISSGQQLPNAQTHSIYVNNVQCVAVPCACSLLCMLHAPKYIMHTLHSKNLI